MRHFSSESYLERQRQKARQQRDKRGLKPAVHYFHQVDDPYSHLAVQKLIALQNAYELPFQPHLIAAADAAYRGSDQHFDAWALHDAQAVAGHYDTHFAPAIDKPVASAVDAANTALADHLGAADFAECALETGDQLWAGQIATPGTTSDTGKQAIQDGTKLQRKLGHYQGGMFYFDGEWFWGVDRLRLLEQRLTAEGFARQSGTLCVPEPQAPDTRELDTSQLVLEYFPSLRSPYTAIGHQRVLALVERSGVTFKVRPVMPMLMRGIPAPREKQRYIITDAGREARACGNPFGRIVDPFGEPVKRAFALFAGAQALQKASEFVTAYLNAAWFDGVDITRERGLQQVAAAAGIEWAALTRASSNEDWETLLQANLDTMFHHNLWGVPSFRVTDATGVEPYACWGQDRIWRVESELAARAHPQSVS